MQVQDNRLSSVQSYCRRILESTDIAEEEYRPIFLLLVTELLQRPNTDLLLANEVRLSESEILLMLQAIKDIRAGQPIQHIIGHMDFHGLRITCDSRALIPRPETEELVRWILDEQSAGSTGLDIGTGTGSIAIALAAHLPSAEISALDISTEALSLATANALSNDVNIRFTQDNILKPSSKFALFDFIVSNPPYVRQIERSEMNSRVLDHDPHLALFVPNDDPLIFYRHIGSFAQHHLHSGGSIYLEINEYLGQETAELLRTQGFEPVELRQDLSGKDRMLRGSWNG